MKPIAVFSIIVFILFPLQLLKAQSSDADISVDEIARALGYPNGEKLNSSDNIISARNQTPGVIWSRAYQSSDGSFPIVTISIAPGHAALTPELNTQLQHASEQVKTLPDGTHEDPKVNAINLDELASGFVFPTGFGPGGGGHAAVVTTSDGHYDYVVRISFSSDQTVHSDNVHYLALANASEKNNLETLASVLKKLFPSLVNISQKLPHSDSNADILKPSVATSSVTGPSTTNERVPDSAAPSSVTQPSASTIGIPIWLYCIIVLGLVIIVGLWYRSRPKK